MYNRQSKKKLIFNKEEGGSILGSVGTTHSDYTLSAVLMCLNVILSP